jgi:uncharacterized protein (TIGR02246 family)
MKRLSFVLIVLAAPALLAQSTPPATQSIDAAIRAVADQYVKATLAGDAKAIAALYTEDAVEMPPNEPAVKGRAAIQQHYEKLFKEGKVSRFTLTHLETRSAGDIGYDVGTYNQSMTPAGGTDMPDSGKFVVILKRMGGSWRVAYAIYNSDRPAMPAK